MKLETERLILRPLEVADAETLSKLWIDPDVTRYMGGPRNYEELYVDFVKDAEDKSPLKFDLWPVMEKTTGKIIGHCGLINKEVEGKQEIELVYVLTKTAWGNGYATEIASAIAEYSFKELGLQRIISLIDSQNVASENVAKKIGMKYEKDILRPNNKTMRVYSKTVKLAE
jgi:ribosomal-protein-alanine N-acetyltransferase